MVHDRVPENQILAHKSIPISFVGNIYLQVVTCGVANWNKETPSTSMSAWVVPWCLQQKIEKQPGLADVEEVPKYIHLAPSPSYIHFTTILWTHTNSTYLAVSWKTLCSSNSHLSLPFPPSFPTFTAMGSPQISTRRCTKPLTSTPWCLMGKKPTNHQLLW